MIAERLAPALLERWMRSYYFDTDFDLGSSGVETFSMAELRRILGITVEELDDVMFRDSRTLGDTALRYAIAKRWGTGDLNEAFVTHGSSEAIHLVMQALLRAGDEVVVTQPCYQQLHAFAEAFGCRIIPWVLRAEDGFRPDLDAFESLLSPHTRLVVLNVPHNPTGFALTADDEGRLAAMADARGAYLLWDRAFAEVLHARSASVRKQRGTREISIGTLSKAYGLPGLRIGWCIADPGILEIFAHLRDYTTLHLSPIVELIARRAIEGGDQLLSLRLGQARSNLRMVEEWMAEHRDRVEWIAPDASVSAFPRLITVSDVDVFCRQLAITERVLLVPGSCFSHPRHVRLGFGGPADELREGLRRLSRAIPRAMAA